MFKTDASTKICLFKSTTVSALILQFPPYFIKLSSFKSLSITTLVLSPVCFLGSQTDKLRPTITMTRINKYPTYT